MNGDDGYQASLLDKGWHNHKPGDIKVRWKPAKTVTTSLSFHWRWGEMVCEVMSRFNRPMRARNGFGNVPFLEVCDDPDLSGVARHKSIPSLGKPGCTKIKSPKPVYRFRQIAKIKAFLCKIQKVRKA